jgi:hypothetical protein
MNFVFKYPTLGNLTGGKNTYRTSQRHHFTWDNSAILSLDPIYDIVMVHGASFHILAESAKTVGIELDVILWLQSYRDFYASSCTMRLDALSVHRK